MATTAQITKLHLLPSLGKAELRAEWQRLFGRPAPSALRKDLIAKVLAYRIQELRFGSLNSAAGKRLRQIAKACEANPRAPLPDLPGFKSGTRLIGDWKGKPHVVTIIEDGFEYGGKRYSSLSRVARLITGTRWSGPLFFGLKARHDRDHRDGHRN